MKHLTAFLLIAFITIGFYASARSPDGASVVQEAGWVSLGCDQDPDISSASGFSDLPNLSGVPTGATLVRMQAEGAGIRYRTDGTNPTTSVGMIITENTIVALPLANFSLVKYIEDDTSAIINVCFYK